MKTVQQYREDIASLMKKIGDIDAKVTVENRDPFEQEINMKNELMDAIEEIHTNIQALERQESIAKMLSTSNGPVTVPKARIEVGDNNASRQKFNSLGEQLAAVMKASSPGGHADPRLFNATGLNESVPSEGGFLVQTDFTTELLRDVYATGQLASKCRRVTISGNANSMTINGVDETSRATGSRYGGIRGYWLEEAGEKTASKPAFRKIELKLKKLPLFSGCAVPVTNAAAGT
jgi:HK97 family phage major capsid protein